MINRRRYLSNRTIYNPMLRDFFFSLYQDDELRMNPRAAFPPFPSLCIRFFSFQVKYLSDPCHSDNQVSWRREKKKKCRSLSLPYTHTDNFQSWSDALLKTGHQFRSFTAFLFPLGDKMPSSEAKLFRITYSGRFEQTEYLTIE